LHETIIDAMGWLHADEHYFEMKNEENVSVRIGPKSEETEEEQENVNPQEVNGMRAEGGETLRDYFTKETILCRYHLSGAEHSTWLHSIKLEKIENSQFSA
jgi:hypothetical protein